MKIAFVSANRERLPDEVVPLGMLYVIGSVPAPHEKVLWDLCFEPKPEQFLAEKLAAFAPDVVALGLRNIQNSDYSGTIDNLNYYASLLEVIRAHAPRARVVLGGGGFSIIPQGMMERLRADFGISGEGEQSFPLLIEALERGATDFSQIGNLHYFRGGKVVSNPPTPGFLDLNQLPIPDRSLVDPRYYERVGIESVQTKRGCRLNCEYCTYPIIEGRAVRQRDPEAVVDELFHAIEVNPKLNHFFIVDSVFNQPPKHAKAVCQAMIRRGFKTPWTCYANPLGFDEELADLMAQAACVGMEIGSESGCNDVLKRLRKGFTTDAIRDIHRMSENAGLRDCHTFILGTRGETLDHVQRTIDFIIDLDPWGAILMAWTDDDEALDPALRTTRRAFRDQIIEILREKQSQFPRWIIPPLQVNFDPRLFAFLRKRGLSGPLWQHVRKIDAPSARPQP